MLAVCQCHDRGDLERPLWLDDDVRQMGMFFARNLVVSIVDEAIGVAVDDVPVPDDLA